MHARREAVLWLHAATDSFLRSEPEALANGVYCERMAAEEHYDAEYLSHFGAAQ